jgi:hypothetical protein
MQRPAHVPDMSYCMTATWAMGEVGRCKVMQRVQDAASLTVVDKIFQVHK